MLARQYYLPFAICFGVIYSNFIEIIPERGSLTYVNDKYLEYANMSVVRYNRRSGYLVNIEGMNRQVWTNNVTLHLVFYEFLHNEYKRSFVEMKFKMCDFINKEPYIGDLFRNRGVVCPIQCGNYHFMNMSIIKQFPYKWPFEKCKVVGHVYHTTKGETIATGELYIRFKQKYS